MTIVLPMRVQRKRTKGYQMPPKTVYVGRPSKWGNPFIIGKLFNNRLAVTHEQAVAFYKWWIHSGSQDAVIVKKKEIKRLLGGKNLACWCALKDKYGKIVPCHADILLKIANE